jgi:hypothetical protein
VGAAGGNLAACAVCGNPELYKQKHFPHWLGLLILAAASLAFIVCNAFYRPRLAWAVLIGSALFDGALYLAVRDLVVCYRCGARYADLAAGPDHRPFELVTAERYRQERLRRARIDADQG